MATLTSVLDSPPGGVMTDEVGVITGELELVSTCDPDGSVKIRVRYVGALDWYTVSGTDVRLHDSRDHEALHTAMVGVLNRSQS